MAEEAQSRRNIIAEVVRVGLRDDEYGTIELVTAEGAVVALDLSLRTMAPVIMALFSAASALQDRRYAAKRERTVLALPIRDAAGTAVDVGDERHVVVSLRLEGDAIFRFSMPPAAAERLGRSLTLALGSGLN